MATNPCWYYRNYDETDNTHLVKNDQQKIFSIEELGWTAPNGKVFKEWNSEQDGTGDSLMPINNYGEYAMGTWYAIWDYRYISKVDLNGEVYYLKDKFIRENGIDPETMANVKTTLAKYGLDTTTEFTSPVVGTGVVGQTVSMPS